MSSTTVQPENTILVRGARVHNLRDVDVDVPRDALVVFTGVSGSGKSSLAFDTLFAEGQRRYLESLSTYTRQFLDQLERPDADLIDGLPPTISVDQRTSGVGPRSTLATTTEIYDFLRLLYARAGQAHCTGCGRPVSRQSSQAIVEQILALQVRRKVMILAPLVRGRKGEHRQVFEKICKEGFVRARVDGEIVDAADTPKLARQRPHEIEAVVDRIVVKDGIRSRLQESVDLALKHGGGACLVSHEEDDGWHDRLFSEKFACPDCGLSFPELEPNTFSFNSPYGACPDCNGLGVAPDASVSHDSRDASLSHGASFSRDPEGSAPLRVAAERCAACDGNRLNAFARSVTIAAKAVHEWTALTIGEALAFAEGLIEALDDDRKPVFSPEGREVAARTLPEVAARLRFLLKVGLDYATLDRPTRTLSGGEFQRARLAGCLGSGLIGVCYILDEPTIGLHPRDIGRLIETLVELRDQGNSVLVVEHDPDLIRRADYLIDLGPGAGREGGRIVATGSPREVADCPESVTGRYLELGSTTSQPKPRRPISPDRILTLTGARLHNLKDIVVQIPLGVLTCVTGVSGSGKSSLISETLVPAVRRALASGGGMDPREKMGTGTVDRPVFTRGSTGATEPVPIFSRPPFDTLSGVEHLERVVEIDQSPIGRSGRSSPATYSGVWDDIRKVFAKTREARLRGYTARRFSFNAKQGRCQTCRGQGTVRIEMHFLPEMHVACPDCKGARFNRQTLAVRFAGKNAADVLRMRIDEAAGFFENFPKVRQILDTFTRVGLGYLCLGQSSLTLSGGEAQRVKLATELSRTSGGPTLFVLDEPTTGLHPADVERLTQLLDGLVERGHSVVIVEHQLDVIAAADWVVDLGPDGGAQGGTVVAQGPPDEIARVAESHTGRALLARRPGSPVQIPASGRP